MRPLLKLFAVGFFRLTAGVVLAAAFCTSVAALETETPPLPPPHQPQLVGANEVCTAKIEMALNPQFELCVAGKWTRLPQLVTWAPGQAMLDAESGCVYQINKGKDGILRTALVTSIKCARAKN
jgi:hypothetical protein